MASIRKFELSLPQAKAILKKHNLGEAKQIMRFEKGMINDVFLINNEYVLKINTGHPDLPKLKKEKDIYELLAKMGIPVPKVYTYDSSKEILEFPYIIMEKIKGSSLNDIWSSMKKTSKLQQMQKIGELMGKIHSITFDNFGDDFSNDKFNGIKTYKEFMKKHVKNILNNVKDSKVLEENKIKKIQKYFEENKYFNITPKASLLHGNFNYDNLLVENGIIHGIVDWEWAKSMHNEEEAGTFFYRILKEDKEFISSFKKGYEKYIKLNKGFNQRYKAYNLLYYLKVLPDVKKWVHRPDKQKEYYEEVNKLYHEVIDKND